MRKQERNSGNNLLEEQEEGAGQTKGGVYNTTKEIVSAENLYNYVMKKDVAL